MKVNKQKIKEAILDFEYRNWTAGGSLSGRDVQVKNLKLQKEKAIADIILFEYDDNLYQERHNNCEYGYRELGL